MVFKLGTLFHAKGYAINKLFEQHRFGAKHLPTHLLQQGYPPRWRHLISMAVDEQGRGNNPHSTEKNRKRHFGPRYPCLV